MSTGTSIRHCGGAAGFARHPHFEPRASETSAASIHAALSRPAPSRRGGAGLLLRVGLALALAGAPLAASAAYKCPAGNGHYTYQDAPCEQAASDAAAPAPDAAPAPAAPAPAPATPAAAPATPATAPAPAAAAPAPASPAPAPAAAAAAPAPAAATAAPAPYLGGDEGNPDAEGDAPSDGDTPMAADGQDSPDAQGGAGSDAAPEASLAGIFARLALKAAIWLALAAYVGYRATQRNRGFFKWSVLALVFSPALIYLILRVMGPADEMA